MRYVALGATFYFNFTTRDYDTGAPQTLGGSPVISAYEENNTTEITAGITLTADYDSRTGFNNVAVVATAGNGYEAGKYYAFVITTGTVDTVSVVGEVVHEIVIGPVDANVTQYGGTAGTFASGVPEVNTIQAAGTAWGSGAITAGAIATDAITAAKIAADAIGASELAADAATEIRDAVTGGAYALDTDANGRVRIVDGVGVGEINTNAGAIALVDTCTTNTDMRGTDNAALASVVGALTDAAAAGDPTTADTVMQYVKQLVNVLVGTTGVTTFPAEAAPANNVSLAEVVRAIHADVTGLNGDAMRGTDSAALESVCTEARLAELDAANIPADVDGIKTKTDSLTFTTANQVDANMLAISSSTAAADNLEESTEAIITGTAQTGTLTTTVMTSDLTGYLDDELIGRTIIWKSGTADGQASDITDYASASGTVTYTAIPTAPANGDLFVIV